MESNKDIIELANGKTYIVVDTIIIDNINYAYLVSDSDKDDSLFQRVKYHDEKPIFSFIESDKEFDLVLKSFGEKYKDLIENN